MPTFNQLVRKGRQTSVKKSNCTCTSEGLQLPAEETYKYFFSAEERCMYRC